MTSKKQLVVGTWNILMDTNKKSKLKEQSARIPKFAKTIKKQRPCFDVVSVCEVETSNNGKELADLSEYKYSSWTPHSRKNEHIGLILKNSGDITFYDIGDNRRIATTIFDGILIIGVHLTFKVKGTKIRAEQAKNILDIAKNHEKVIIMGDFNCLVWQKPRRMLESDGFTSAFVELEMKHPVTAPVKEYRKYLKRWQRLLAIRGFSADDIYVKNLDVVDIDLMQGPSDHLGISAIIEY